MRRRTLHLVAPLLAGAALAACSKSTTSDAAADDAGAGAGSLPGGFVATLSGASLTIASADGRPLFEGLPPDAVADGAPPLVGFAVRDVAESFEMRFGSFKRTETPNGPWRVGQTLTRVSPTQLVVADAAGKALAHLAFAADDGAPAGALRIDVTPGDGPERVFSWGFRCNPDDHFIGFGAQTADVDQRGQTVPVWVSEQGVGKVATDDLPPVWFVQGTRHQSYFPLPEMLSRRGYVFAADTTLFSRLALCSERSDAARVEVTMPVSFRIFDGPSPAQAIERATARLGRPRMPPRAAFAPWNDAILGSANVRRVAKKLRDAGVPSSAIWTEDWRGGEWKGDSYTLKEEWEVDRTLYPDFEQVAKDLHDLGFQWHVYFNSFVYSDSKAWPETAPKGFLVKKPDGTPYTFTGVKMTDCALLDLDNPDAKAWAIGKLQKAMQQGADGWMADYAEWLPTDAVTAKGPSLPQHNVYPVRWQETNRAAVDGMNDGNAQRLFYVRSGWYGTAPLADVVWAGDQRTDFEADDGLPTILPMGIGLGVIGISTYAHDIAGYQSATNKVSTKELFFRWTELGAWSPVMRTHHGTNPQRLDGSNTNAEWSWETDSDSIAHFATYAKLHMSLVPYLEGLAKVASTSGLPIWRGLPIAFPEDASVWAITDEVLVGDGVLVAPVATAGATSRGAYLPAGRWYPWDGGAAVDGGAKVTASAPVDRIPVWARAGAIVPTWPDGVMTVIRGGAAGTKDDASVGDDRVVHAFLGADGAFTEADGALTYAIASSPAALPAGALAATWNGAALAACAAAPVAPCLEATADGARAHVTGPGMLAVTIGGAPAGTVTASGGASTRALVLDLRR